MLGTAATAWSIDIEHTCAGWSGALAAQHEAAAGAAAAGPVFAGPPSFTLEASVGRANQLDLDLLATGAFGAEVHPDLPIATTWHGLYKQISSRLQGTARRDALAAAAKAQSKAAAVQMMADIASCEEAMDSQGLKPVLHVATVGAQLSSMADISDAMCTAAGVTPSGVRREASEHRPHADALLLVSGSHPVRTLPLLQQFLPGSVAMLRQASQLKQRGVLPQQLQLWAVANPVMEPDASYTEQKVAAGAQVILTQPPLDWARFEAWMEDARRRQLHSAARLLVGFPLLSSAANVAFWGALCGAGGNQQVQQLQQQFAAAEEADKQQQQQQAGKRSQPGPSAFAQQWNSALLQRLQATAGVSGLHVMPITANAKRMALAMAQQGAFTGSAWPLAGKADGSSSSSFS
ncbi:hypothetical protein OEZ86_000072 [Tetradesmus obliquus]|nr:hypothetical protein OEZ86_000072 [Tetradesmus obliquus]